MGRIFIVFQTGSLLCSFDKCFFFFFRISHVSARFMHPPSPLSDRLLRPFAYPVHGWLQLVHEGSATRALPLNSNAAALESLVGDAWAAALRLRLREASQVVVDVDELLRAPRRQPRRLPRETAPPCGRPGGAY